MLRDLDIPSDAVSERPRGFRRGPAARLVGALIELGGGKSQLIRHTETSWASVTFSGERHTIELRFAGADGVLAGENLVARISDHEFAIPGRLVADAAVTAVDHRLLPEPCLGVILEILTLEDG